MSAHYDTYDYPAYWEGRDYEHQSELLVMQSFLSQIPHRIKRALEIGGGYGRLVPSYLYRSEKVILTDPSAKLLSVARKGIHSKKVLFLQSKVENIAQRITRKSVDLIVIVRVLHHISDIDQAFHALSKVSKDNGYLIMEFANKMHAKAAFTELCKGNLTFPLDIFPRDLRSKKAVKKKTLPFINYHPDDIAAKLSEYGFKILDVRSVSNVRNSFIKKTLPMEFLLFLERHLQKPFARFYFGPSIFILAQKVG